MSKPAASASLNKARAMLDMSLPFPPTCHPAIEDIERKAMTWVSEFVDVPTLRHLEKTRAGRIAARTAAPHASVDLLHAYSRMLAWGFWFDDEFVDDLPATSPLHLPAIASVLDILDGRRGTGASGEAMEAALTEVMGGLRLVLTPEQFSRWCMELRLWFASMTFQNQMRIAGGTPSVATYKTTRLYTVCSFACIVLIDASWGDHIHWNDYCDPRLTSLRHRAANVTAWQNDVFSYFAEESHPGDFWNLPAVYGAHGLEIGDALVRTVQDANDEVAEFKREAVAAAPFLSKRQKLHIRSLTGWMRGCHDWSLEAGERYVGWATATKSS
ncbi:terpene synthase family protein [Streptomyces sparsus]